MAMSVMVGVNVKDVKVVYGKAILERESRGMLHHRPLEDPFAMVLLPQITLIAGIYFYHELH